MKKFFITLLIVPVFGTVALSQENLFGVSWQINFPANDQYIDKTSFSGGKFEYRHIFKRKYSVGVAAAWTNYEQHFPRQTFVKPDGNSAITSDFVAQAYQVPLTAIFHYYFHESKQLVPYAGIGLGAQYLEQTLYYNVYASDDNNWGFVMQPEVGAIIKLGSRGDWGVNVSAFYSWATNKTELVDNNNFSNFGFNIGLIFRD